jgi:hypothetical protein
MLMTSVDQQVAFECEVTQISHNFYTLKQRFVYLHFLQLFERQILNHFAVQYTLHPQCFLSSFYSLWFRF